MKRNLRAQADYKVSLLRNQLTSLVLFESITTTKKKAKELIPYANHFFNRIKSTDFNSKRLAAKTMFDANAVKKIFEEIMPRYKDSETTFVRHYKVMPRKGDSAEMVMISLIRPLEIKKESKKVNTDPDNTKGKTAIKLKEDNK